MKKALAIIFIVIGIVLILGAILVYFSMLNLLEEDLNFFNMLGFIFTSPPVLIALILIGIGIWGLLKKKK